MQDRCDWCGHIGPLAFRVWGPRELWDRSGHPGGQRTTPLLGLQGTDGQTKSLSSLCLSSHPFSKGELCSGLGRTSTYGQDEGNPGLLGEPPLYKWSSTCKAGPSLAVSPGGHFFPSWVLEGAHMAKVRESYWTTGDGGPNHDSNRDELHSWEWRGYFWVPSLCTRTYARWR